MPEPEVFEEGEIVHCSELGGALCKIVERMGESDVAQYRLIVVETGGWYGYVGPETLMRDDVL